MRGPLKPMFSMCPSALESVPHQRSLLALGFKRTEVKERSDVLCVVMECFRHTLIALSWGLVVDAGLHLDILGLFSTRGFLFQNKLTFFVHVHGPSMTCSWLQKM